MKMFFLVMVCFCACVLFCCNYFSVTKSVQDFIPGTYISNWTGPYSETRDTFLIELMAKEGSTVYAITRRTYINYTAVAEKKTPEYKITHWVGLFDERSNTVMINNNGRVLSFDPNAGEMKMGIVSYKKL